MMRSFSSIGMAVAAASAALAAQARDVAACSPWPDRLDARAVFPPDGATQVPTNARVLVEYTGRCSTRR